MSTASQLENYIGGAWAGVSAADHLPVTNPATAEVMARVPLSPTAEVERAVQAAAKAFPEWRRTPAGDRIQYLFKLKNLLEENLDGLARTLTNEAGKT
ncbi:MAG: aldehyde dehydrogenase family protein, partial [Terriglobia bacterium]